MGNDLMKYFDYAATTPMSEEAIKRLCLYLKSIMRTQTVFMRWVSNLNNFMISVELI